MNKEEVEILISKYYQGETTPQEDQALLIFFENDKSDFYKSEKAQFQFYKISKENKPIRSSSEQFDKKVTSPSGFPISIQSVTRIAAIIIVAIGLSYYYFQFKRTLIEISTKGISKMEVELPDGSKVWINRFSTLKYPEKFDYDKREIFLEGEAYFEVVQDSRKPFIVHSLQATTKVVGTSFNIRSYIEENTIELTVYSGKVLFGLEKKADVFAGSHMILKKKGGQLTESRFKNLNSLAWKSRELKFENSELRDVFRDLERCFGTKFVIEQKHLLNCHFNGIFFEPKLQDVLNVIKYALAIEYNQKEDTVYITGQGCGR
jgi:transmembrane sensor